MVEYFVKLIAQQEARSGVSHDCSQPVVRNTDHTLGDLGRYQIGPLFKHGHGGWRG